MPMELKQAIEFVNQALHFNQTVRASESLSVVLEAAKRYEVIVDNPGPLVRLQCGVDGRWYDAWGSSRIKWGTIDEAVDAMYGRGE